MFCSLNNLFTPESKTKSNFGEQLAANQIFGFTASTGKKTHRLQNILEQSPYLPYTLKSSHLGNPQSPDFFTVIGIRPQSHTTSMGKAATKNMLYESPYPSNTMGDPFRITERPQTAPNSAPRTPLQHSCPYDHPPRDQLTPSPALTTSMSSSPNTLSTTYLQVNTPGASFQTLLPSSQTPRTPLSTSASPSPFRFWTPELTLNTPISPPQTRSSSHICTLCNPPKALATNGTLQRHINTIHFHRSFKCTKCNRVCSSQAALDRHIRDNLCSSVKCSICRTGNLFKNQTALEKHMMTEHLEEYKAAVGLLKMTRSAEKVNLCHPEPECRDTESEYEDGDMDLYEA